MGRPHRWNLTTSGEQLRVVSLLDCQVVAAKHKRPSLRVSWILCGGAGNVWTGLRMPGSGLPWDDVAIGGTILL